MVARWLSGIACKICSSRALQGVEGLAGGEVFSQHGSCLLWIALDHVQGLNEDQRFCDQVF